jgi:hypothetical protein
MLGRTIGHSVSVVQTATSGNWKRGRFRHYAPRRTSAKTTVPSVRTAADHWSLIASTASARHRCHTRPVRTGRGLLPSRHTKTIARATSLVSDSRRQRARSRSAPSASLIETPPPLVIISSSCITAHPSDFQRPTGQHHPPQTPRTEKARISNPGFSNKRLELGYTSF